MNVPCLFENVYFVKLEKGSGEMLGKLNPLYNFNL